MNSKETQTDMTMTLSRVAKTTRSLPKVIREEGRIAALLHMGRAVDSMRSLNAVRAMHCSPVHRGVHS